ncbi:MULTISPECIES: hypothetical protein [Brevibacillus]|nr:hypothetical protein [Brevibacillus borstelensis]MCC0566284.1 hypothetical protein [Brevibacillus borstelensis]MCM3472969.1 hypothetical protein [Brevibacillus borstelensis]MCM3561094.1 hypothetical protein [Brevibacillus borstelensis]MCM3593001.1 hypothetical protein [Brevibacillus borstelensis]MCM3624884.1 hypothetical protein [Brevibacillus borstelensis]
MMNNKRIFFRFLFGGAAALAAVVLAANFTKITAAPPDDTRMILEHTHRTYISPPCYEQAQKTNHIAESTLGEARTHSYSPESACTEQSLQPIQITLSAWLQEKLGIQKGKWDW